MHDATASEREAPLTRDYTSRNQKKPGFELVKEELLRLISSLMRDYTDSLSQTILPLLEVYISSSPWIIPLSPLQVYRGSDSAGSGKKPLNNHSPHLSRYMPS
jgi:hypothetical protein